MIEQVEIDFTATKFGGSDYDKDEDCERMADGMARVFSVMKYDPERKLTLKEIALESGMPQSSVGSYLCYIRRDLGYAVPKKYISDGLYTYKLGDKLSPEEIVERKVKKVRPVGDKELFGEMLRSIYALAHANNTDNQFAMQGAMRDWSEDFITKIQEKN